MSSNANNQLATLLFADIAGYTTLMQNNEQQALTHLQNFTKELETTVPTYHGKIIQFYGDGCLVLFDDPRQAVDCAKVLQVAFQEQLGIPVRIGLHRGAVTFKDGNLFGETVDITSRVEAMGMPGAILMTSSVWYPLKNDLSFQWTKLGKFQFKNVEKGMSVYALTNDGLPIPSVTDMQGRLQPSQNARQFNFSSWWLPALLAIVLGVVLWNNSTKKTRIDRQILKERIAVLPFNNNTNDPTLDVLGDMASDWINTGLMSFGEAEVVSPFTVRMHKASIGVLENDPQNRPSFAQLTGAQNLITGNYYKDKSTIIFKLELVDAQDGQLRFSFKEIRGDEKDKEALITRLRAQVMGYWAAREMVDAKKMKVPNFEAYKLYLEELNSMIRGSDYNRILALDSTFYLARIQFLNFNRGASLGKNRPHFAFLERHAANLSEYEMAWFQYLKGIYIGEIEAAFNSLNKIRVKYPKDFMLNHSTATLALEGLNNPELCLAIYEELPLEENLAKTLGLLYNHRINNILISRVQLGQIEEGLAFVNTVPYISVENANLNHYMRTILYEALLSQEEEKIELAYNQLEDIYEGNAFSYFFLVFNLEQSILVPDNLRKRLQKDVATFYNKLPPTDINRVLWRNLVARLTNQPELFKLEELEHLPKSFRGPNLASAGLFYAKNNQPALIRELIERLQELTTPDYSTYSQVGTATAYYFIGRLYTKLGEYDIAIEYLKKARAVGAETRLTYFQYDRHLHPLLDLPAFQELLKPIWPSSDEAEVVVLEVNQYRAALGRLENLTADFKSKQQLQLAAGDRFFTLKLGTSNHFNAQGVVYHYKIKEVDKDWLVADKGDLTISGLPYGAQTLSIKAGFPNGRFTKKILEIPIQVSKPFYLTIWFLLGLAGTIAAGIYLWTRRLEQQKAALEEEVVRRTGQIKKQAEELKQLDKVKSNFFANVSHELRTPLTLILGPLDRALKRENLSKEEFTLLKMMQQNGQDLQQLVNEILDLSKLEAGKLTLQEAPIPLYPLLQRLVSTFESYAQKKGVELVLEYKAHTHLQVKLDKNKFEKIVNNLLSNALKFTPKNGQVTVLLEDLGHALQLEVSDTGRGIHPEDLPHIFDRFYQTKQVDLATEGGTGIGLALVQEYAKLFGGSMEATSQLKEGSTFSFSFPKKQILKQLSEVEVLEIETLRTKEAPIEEEVKEIKEGIVLASSNKPRVLVVEDNLRLRDYLQLILEDHYQVLTAGNGQEALHFLEQETALPDLLISDLMMPIMDGFQLLKKIKTTDTFRSIPVIMLTARADLQDKLTALRIGVDDYIVKPFVEEELLVRVANLLSNAAARKLFIQTVEVKKELVPTVPQAQESSSKMPTPPPPIPEVMHPEDLAWLAEVERQVLESLPDFDFTLDRLGQMIYLSPRQIRRRLKRLTGLSFSNYLREARFREARRLLELREVNSVKQLAYKIGMRDVKYFSQQFKLHYGKPPSAYLN